MGIAGGEVQFEPLIVGSMVDVAMDRGPLIIGIPGKYRGFVQEGPTDQKLGLGTPSDTDNWALFR